MQSEKVTFDRDQYHLVDTVTANIQLFGPFPDNLRKVEAYLGGYIKTHTTSSDSEGHTNHHHETITIMEKMEVITEPINGHRFAISVIIPQDCPPPVFYEDDNKIEYICHVKYDLSLATDNHSYMPIPIKVPQDSRMRQPIELEDQGLRSRLQSSLISTNSKLSLEVLKVPDINFRSFRIEFRRQIWMQANGYEDTDQEITVLFDQPKPNYRILKFDSPYIDLPSVETETFVIEYMIHIVVDIAFGRDINLDLPVFPLLEYIENNDDFEYDSEMRDTRRCTKCGYNIPPDAEYCGICGQKQ